jgi:heme/copper-type cytochrome/quinol oxidase subunit 2
MYNADEEVLDGIGRHEQARTNGLMSLVVMRAVAIALFLLAAIEALVWAYRSRARAETSVTEAQARAHASRLTRSVLSVGPRHRLGGPGGADA